MARERVAREPLQWDQLTRRDQREATRQMSDFAGGLKAESARQAGMHRARVDPSKKEGANKGNLAKAARLDYVSESLDRTRMSLNQAARNRVDVIEEGVRDYALPGENMPGAGWYAHAGGEARRAAPDHRPDRAAAASSAMSIGTHPETERRALRAMATAETRGRVMRGDPPSMQPWSGVPAKEIPSVVKVQPEAEHVDYTALGGPQSQTLPKATRILRGEMDEPQDPVDNPKTWSYTHNLVQFADAAGTPQEQEYRRRAGELGDKIRGDVGAGQMSLDLYRLGDSEEGILNPRGHTAEDSWQQAITNRHLISDPERRRMALKGTAGIQFTAKGDVARGDASVSASGVQHAYNNEATHRAGAMLQEKYQMDSPVPSTLVQETGWTAIRRQHAQALNKPNATADRHYNAAANAAEVKTPAFRYSERKVVPVADRAAPAYETARQTAMTRRQMGGS